MPNNFTKVTTKGYGQRLGESVVGVLLGIALFFGSFGILYWNEGRVDLSEVAKRAHVISSEILDAEKNGEFISVSGEVFADEDIGDEEYLKPGEYLLVKRISEVYAWEEQEESATQKNIGGSETTTTTYSYKKNWTDAPADSSTFAYPEDHQNPLEKKTKNGEYRPTVMSVGVYTLNGREVDISSGESLLLTEDMVNLPTDAKIQEGYIYLHGANPASPVIGDERLSFFVLKEGFFGTVFGKLDGSDIVRYTDKDENTLFRIFEGDRGEALAIMHGEYTTMLWVIRCIGFLMMWFGMQMILGIFPTLIDVLPFLGGASRAVIGIVTFLIAALLSFVTIVISTILHSFIALVILGVLLICGCLFFVRKKQTA